ncbi:hypothetical protein KP509_19G025900 [Ceratopteris richardii]|uniref:AMP-activated protein kinase glycogen-binding domain-containing protein n=2 Tax=Ceratopteris richardii TaxID=49495 RepID=A0A8T2SMD5_CERRI|nr:hypothetical protein KP509_19G025900 [Ceratopteris richardii]
MATRLADIVNAMATIELFQAESVRLSWLHRDQHRSNLFYSASHCCQRFKTERFRTCHLTPRGSTGLQVFCVSSNVEPELKPRRRRNARSSVKDSEFCKELHLFLVSQGLPLNKVPSTKELSNCGREDLAKVVRRRGYKAVGTLLEQYSTRLGVNQTEVSVNGETQADTGFNPEGDDIAPSTSSIGSDSSRGDDREGNSVTPDDIVQSMESGQDNFSATFEENNEFENISESAANLNGGLSIEMEAELRKKAAEFVRTGLFERILDDSDEEEEEDYETFEDSSDDEDHLQNGQLSTKEIAIQKAAKLRAQLLPFLEDNMTGNLKNQIVGSILGSSEGLEALGEFGQTGKNSHSEADVEIQAIKSALVDKERELREISRNLEETKAQLVLIQAKTTAELAQAKQLVVEKEMQLKSAELALANFKRVQVEYWGEGERVELAGSFNGWKYFVLMESDPTSEIKKADGSRGPMMWETELWLYPGVYEIKFIVDGIWKVDERREIITRNSHHNNVLRVDQ